MQWQSSHSQRVLHGDALSRGMKVKTLNQENLSHFFYHKSYVSKKTTQHLTSQTPHAKI